ncbi:protein starmaker-like [Cynara cardunculus var. scolymus]|uniref:protein starmaker-like n=1 Tax=Cynara cardunculus var. scolymus TaxID=59895 RepID=UPI000D626841|nr:protein starmaker-like [Cynara cardunculus var. scolymus]
MEKLATEDARENIPKSIDDDDDADDVVDTAADHEDIRSSTSTFLNVGDEDDKDEYDDDEDSKPQLPNTVTDLGGNDDDDDDDDDDFYVQIIPILPAKGIFIRKPAFEGDKSSRNQHSSDKGKRVADENLSLVLGAISQSENVDISRFVPLSATNPPGLSNHILSIETLEDNEDGDEVNTLKPRKSSRQLKYS